MKDYYNIRTVLEDICKDFPYEKMPHVHIQLLMEIMEIYRTNQASHEKIDASLVKEAWTNACIHTL